jgi:hypothetical protein
VWLRGVDVCEDDAPLARRRVRRKAHAQPLAVQAGEGCRAAQLRVGAGSAARGSWKAGKVLDE